MIGSASQRSKNEKKNSKKTQISALSDSHEEYPSPEITSKINVVESSNKQFKIRKKGKGKAKQDTL